MDDFVITRYIEDTKIFQNPHSSVEFGKKNQYEKRWVFNLLKSMKCGKQRTKVWNGKKNKGSKSG